MREQHTNTAMTPEMTPEEAWAFFKNDSLKRLGREGEPSLAPDMLFKGDKLTEAGVALIVEELNEPRLKSHFYPYTSIHFVKDVLHLSSIDQLVYALVSNSSIKRVELYQNEIEDMGVVYVAMLLKFSKSIQELSLAHNKIGDEGIVSLAKALEKNTTLHSLDISENQIGDAGARALADALRVNRTLTRLDIGNNPISDAAKAELVRAIIESNHTLCHVHGLRHPLLTRALAANQKGAEALAERARIKEELAAAPITFAVAAPVAGLQPVRQEVIDRLRKDQRGKTYKDIHELYFTTSPHDERSPIGDAGAEIVARALRANQWVQRLIMCDNQIGPVGAQALGNMLTYNRSLTSDIFLGNNQIGDLGAIALGEGLKANHMLKELVLYNNQIGSLGARGLAEGLKRNNRLKNLDIMDNAIGDEGAEALAEALKVNTSLTFLSIGNNPIGAAGKAAIVRAVVLENNTLTGIPGIDDPLLTKVLAYNKECKNSPRVDQKARFLKELINDNTVNPEFRLLAEAALARAVPSLVKLAALEAVKHPEQLVGRAIPAEVKEQLTHAARLQQQGNGQRQGRA